MLHTARGRMCVDTGMTQLRDLVARSELGLRVLWGAERLEREVRWVHVTELADPRPYIRDDELVLTNGVWLDATDPATYVARLADTQACGLMFGLLAERPEAPPELAAACAEHELVLLTLPIEVPFTAISQAMADLQASARHEELARTIDRGNALARAIAEGTGERGVLRLLTVDHALPVALVDAGGHVLAVEGTTREAIDAAAVAGALAGPRRVEVEFEDATVASLFRVGTLAKGDAALLCLRALVDLTAPERDALEQTARYLTVEFARRQALHAIESRFAGELLEMLYDPTRRGHELPGRLRSFGIDAAGTLAVLSIAFTDGDATAPGLADVIGQLLVRWGVPGVVPQGSEDAVAILGWTSPQADLERAGRDAIEALAREWPGRRAVVGIGRLAAGDPELRRSLLEAREARRVAQRRRRGPEVTTFDHVGSHRMLLALHSEHTLEDFAEAVLGPVREHDRAHRAALEDTLRAFLDLGGRYVETAAALHVHVNTLRKRLERVEELTGRDARRPTIASTSISP
jgi:purine catabolism regulator